MRQNGGGGGDFRVSEIFSNRYLIERSFFSFLEFSPCREYFYEIDFSQLIIL